MSVAAQPRPLVLPFETVVARSGAGREFDLLIACCADGLSSTDRVRRIISSPLDWDRVLALVEHHRVIPQVYRQLSPLAHFVPPHYFRALRSRYQDNVRRSLWFAGEMTRVLAYLQSCDVRALAYKGPALALQLYGDVTEREFGDLDVLVHAADVVRVKAALMEPGYQLSVQFTPRQERAYVESGYEYSFRHSGSDALLELQWRILPPFYSFDFDVAGIFERAETVTFGEWSFSTLCPKDLLLALCAHAAKHVWAQLSWLCDIARLTRDPRLNWDAIEKEARRLGAERIIAVNLLLAHKLMGSLPPAGFSRWMNDPATEFLATEVLHVIERNAPYDTESIPYFRLMMKLRERWRDRARFLWRLALTPGMGEWKAIRLPDRLFPLYPFVRFFRLGKRLTLS